jgi:hypothetical protein
MGPKPFLALVIILASAAAPGIALPQAAANTAAPRRLRFLAELSASPLIGIDRPFKGGSGCILAGAALAPFEAGIRAGAAYDLSLGSGELRVDFELGLGSGLRAIVGALVPFGELRLPDPAGGELGIPVAAAAWPNRFGFATTIVDLPWRILGFRAGIDAELVYTAYRLGGSDAAASSSLAGAAAFASAIEAAINLRLRWETK